MHCDKRQFGGQRRRGARPITAVLADWPTGASGQRGARRHHDPVNRAL
jgi:hypothetical protein